LSFFSRISHLGYLFQTLTTLDISKNMIEAKGAQAIGQALQRNQVR